MGTNTLGTRNSPPPQMNLDLYSSYVPRGWFTVAVWTLHLDLPLKANQHGTERREFIFVLELEWECLGGKVTECRIKSLVHKLPPTARVRSTG